MGVFESDEVDLTAYGWIDYFTYLQYTSRACQPHFKNTTAILFAQTLAGNRACAQHTFLSPSLTGAALEVNGFFDAQRGTDVLLNPHFNNAKQRNRECETEPVTASESKQKIAFLIFGVLMLAGHWYQTWLRGPTSLASPAPSAAVKRVPSAEMGSWRHHPLGRCLYFFRRVWWYWCKSR